MTSNKVGFSRMWASKFQSLIAIASVALVTAVTEANAGDQQFYVEGGLGIAQIGDLEGGTTATAGAYSAAINLSLDYKPSLVFGGELGISDVFDTRFRAGLSAHFFKAKLDKLTGSASVNFNGSTILSGAGTVSASQVASAGLSFDNDVRLYSANIYYDFHEVNGFVPYVGIGLGLADIENAKDKEFAFSGHIGANYNLGNDVYVGVKGSVHHVDGPTDQIGVPYDDVVVWSGMAVIGKRF